MTAISIVRETTDADGKASYRAIAHDGQTRSVGRTPGEALDALTAQLGDEESGTLVAVQQMRPDRFFGAAEIVVCRS